VNHLIIDTETTGLPMESRPIDWVGQPWPVELAAVLCDDELRVRSTLHMLDVPPVEIPEETIKIHGITLEVARRFGVSPRGAMGALMRLYAVADVVVGHRVSFDDFIVRSTCARSGVPAVAKPLRCTKEAAGKVLEKGHSTRLAPVRLTLCGRETPSWHSALPDVEACLDVYAALLARGCWAQEGGAS
jgi:DNA polymerase III epsilon subunit-like protein